MPAVRARPGKWSTAQLPRSGARAETGGSTKRPPLAVI